MRMFQGSASTNIDGLNQDEENIKPNTDSSEGEKQAAWYSTVITIHLCFTSHCCDIDRISNLAMNYFYVVNICSHFPYISIVASNNSLLIFKMFPINIIWIRGSPKIFLSIFPFIFSHIMHPIYLH